MHRSILGLDDLLTGKSILNKIVEWMEELYPTLYERFKLWVNQQYKTKKNININQIISEDKNYNIKPTKRKPFFSVNFITTMKNNYGYKFLYEGIKKAILDIEPQLNKYILSIDDIKTKEPKVKVVKEDNKKIKNEWFTKQKRDGLLLLRKKNPLIGDIIEHDVEHYDRLILPTNGKFLIKNIDWYNPKKYKRLEKYIDEIIKHNKKINILSFINNQITQLNTPHLFYPPYLQNYIALNGLYILHKVIEILFKSINKNMKDYIIIKSKDEIEQYENKHYSYLKNISSSEKSSIRMHYHNFIPNDYKHYNDFYLSYYVHI